MRRTARKAEYRSQRKAVAGSEECSVGDCACQSPQGTVFAAKQIIRQVHGSEYVERTANNADQRKGMPVDGHANLTIQELRIDHY